PLTGERRGGSLRVVVDVLRQFVAVERAAELDRFLRRLRERQAAAAARHALAGDLIRLGAATEDLRRDLLKLLLRVARRGVRRARHRVRGLAAALSTRVRHVLRRVAPGDLP